MANSLSGVSPLSLAAEQARPAFKAPAARDSAAFSGKLVAELSRSLKRMGLSAGVTVQPGADAKQAARQILVSYRTPPSPPPAPTGPVDVLRAALAEAGLDPAAYNLTESRQVVNYPGGSYVNHFVTAQFAGGYTESYDVGLMLRDPKVTVVEMRRASGYRNS